MNFVVGRDRFVEPVGQAGGWGGGAPQPPEPQGDELNFGALVAQLLARKWLVFWCVLAGAMVGAAAGQLPPDTFRARAVVQIEQRPNEVTLPAELIGEMLTGEDRSEASLATEFHIIRSRLILDPVVERLGLDLRVRPLRAPVIGDLLMRTEIPLIGGLVDRLLPRRFARGPEQLEVGRFVVAERLAGLPFLLEGLGADRFRITSPDGTVAEGIVGETVSAEGLFEVDVSRLAAAEGRQFRLVREPVRVGSERLAEQLEVQRRGSSEIVDFEFFGGDGPLAQRIVNAVVTSYKDQNLDRRSKEIDQTILFIEQQIPEVERSQAEAEAALQAFRDSRSDEELSLGTQDLLARAVRLEASLRDFEFREAQLAASRAESDPALVALRDGMVQLRARLEEVRAQLSRVPTREQELASLTERVASERQLLIQLESRIEQLRILKASTVGNIRTLEPAESAERVGPDRRRPALLGGVAALLFAVLAVLGRNALNRGIQDPRAIEALGLPLFASVGKVREIVGRRAGAPRYALALSEPGHLAVEALRGLRTGLQFSLSAAQNNSLMITSCAPSDGKSFLSLNLALVAAGVGGRVLLMDCDMRRGELRRHFGLDRNAAGLSDLLAGKAAFGDVIRRDAESGLEFIASGAYPPNPSELLSTARFASLVESLDEHYDLIVLDAPPALAVTDPGIIGRHAGLSLLVARHLATSAADVQNAQKMLSNAGVSLSGAILNQFDARRSKYGRHGAAYGSYYGGYRYEYGGG